MSCWGSWQCATSLYYFTSCLRVCIVLCPVSQLGFCIWSACECICSVYVPVLWVLRSHCWSGSTVTTAPNPHAMVCTPPNPISVPVYASFLSPPTSLFYTCGGTLNKGDKVAWFPPCLSYYSFTDNTSARTHFEHIQSPSPLSNLHIKLNSSLMHRHTVALSTPWASKRCCYWVGVYSLLKRSIAACL